MALPASLQAGIISAGRRPAAVGPRAPVTVDTEPAPSRHCELTLHTPLPTPRSRINTTFGHTIGHEDWLDGDALLISADNQRFYVDSSYIYGAGQALYDRGTSGDGPFVIQFTDDEHETGDSINIFLQFVVYRRVDQLAAHVAGDDRTQHAQSQRPANDLQRLRLGNLIFLLVKYDCVLLVRDLREILGADAQSPQPQSVFCGQAIFIAGVALRDIHLAVLALTRRKTANNNDSRFDDARDRAVLDLMPHTQRPGYHCLNHAGMTVDLYMAIPRAHLFALTRAFDISNDQRRQPPRLYNVLALHPK